MHSCSGAIRCSCVLAIVLFNCFGGVKVLLFCEIAFFSTLQTPHSSSLTSIWTKRHFGQRTVSLSPFWIQYSHSSDISSTCVYSQRVQSLSKENLGSCVSSVVRVGGLFRMILMGLTVSVTSGR